jgi:hypothetical protein
VPVVCALSFTGSYAVFGFILPYFKSKVARMKENWFVYMPERKTQKGKLGI